MASPSNLKGDRTAAALAAAACISLIFIAVPLIGLLTQVRWSHLGSDLATAEARSALLLSLRTTTLTTVIAAIFGTPLAWWLAHHDGRPAALVRALVTVPLVLPPVVGGVALLVAWGRGGVIGSVIYDATGWSIPYSWVRVVIAETFVSMPFFVIGAESAFRGLETRWSQTAALLGANSWQTLTRVLLPLALPGLAAGLTLTWARALGEFGATITFAGSFPDRTMTAPLAVYQALDVSSDAANALAALMLIISVVVLVLLRGHWVGARR